MKRSLLLSAFLLISVCLNAQTTLTINTTTGGSLQTKFLINSYDTAALINLTITGVLDAQDFRFMRDGLTSLAVLDISGTSIVSYTGPNGPMVGAPNRFYPANELPYCAFFDPAGTHSGKPTLTSVILPNTLKNIGNYSLQDCYSLASVTIPTSLDTIKPYAFHYDTALINTNIPSGVDVIMEGAFQMSKGVTVDAGNANYSSLDGVLFNKNKSVLITCPYSKYTYTVPASVDTLGFESFYGCRHLASVNIPTTVSQILNGAFSGSGLISVTIPSSVTRIEESVFFYCQKLMSVSLPNTITYLGFGAFYGCIALPSIDIPASVDTIQAMCFYTDSAMTSVSLHQGIKYIGFATFQGCSHLTSINIPTTLTSLSSSLFFYCKSLSNIIIPSSITSIESSAFAKCYGLSSIYSESVIPVDLSSSPGVFLGVDTNTCILYVPIGSVNLYESANQWKDFNIMQENDFGINTASAEGFKVFVENCNLNIWEIPYGENVTIYTLQGIQILDQKMFSDRLTFRLPNKGMYIVKIGKKTGKVIAE